MAQSVTYWGAAIWSLSGKSGHGSHAGWLMVTHCAGSAALLHQVKGRNFYIDICPYYSYCIILAPVKDMPRRHTVSWERGRCPRAGLQPAPGRLGYHVSRHYDRGGRCFPGLGQAKAGNARADRVPGSLA